MDNNIKNIEGLINKVENFYHKEKGVETQIQNELTLYKKEIAKKEDEVKVYEIKSRLINEVSETARQQSKDMFSRLSTVGLNKILGNHLSVEIESDERAGNPTLDFIVESKYDDITIKASPTEGEGGGVADIVALSAFLNLNYLNTDINKAPLMLDEPTKFVSKGNAQSVSEFIKSVSVSSKKQIIMSTHDHVSKTIADKAFLLIKDEEDGETKIHDVTQQQIEET